MTYKILRGFTLLEMMIVIAVMGILIAIGIKGAGGIMHKAKESAVKSSGHTLQMALETYRLDQGNYPVGTLTSDALIDVLLQNGSLSSAPINPFTQTTYVGSDASGKIEYISLDSGITYTLRASGYKNQQIVFEGKNL